MGWMMGWWLGKIPAELVRRRFSRLRRLLGLLDLIWVQTPLGGSGGEGVCSSLVEVFKDGGEFVLDVVQEPVVLGVDRGVVLGWSYTEVRHRFDGGPQCFWG